MSTGRIGSSITIPKDNKLQQFQTAQQAKTKTSTQKTLGMPTLHGQETRNPYDNAKPEGAQAAGAGGGYSSNPYEAQANALFQRLMTRGDFAYDLQGDPLYRQYADQYAQLGKQAMRDTTGTAASLTGGYGNSFAQGVGSQAYQQYLTQLNAMIPDFYDRAYQRWLDQGTELQNKYNLAASYAGSYGTGAGTATAATTEATPASTSTGIDYSAALAKMSEKDFAALVQALQDKKYLTYYDFAGGK